MAASLTASQIRLPPRALLAASAPDGLPRAPVTLRVSSPAQSLWEKRWWIDKTAKLLRAGEGIGPDDDVEALLKMSEEEVARHFMNDPRFGDALLDFNMYFMGFKADDIKTDGVYNSHAFDFANAISASQALLTDGDYFKLFDLEGDLFMAPLRSEPSEEDMLPGDAGLTATGLRRKAVGELQALFAGLARSQRPRHPTVGGAVPEATSLAAQRDTLTGCIAPSATPRSSYSPERRSFHGRSTASPEPRGRSAVSPDSKLTSNGWGRSSRPLRTSSPRPSRRSSVSSPTATSQTRCCSSGRSTGLPCPSPTSGWRSATSRRWRCRTRRPASTASGQPTS